MKNSFSSTTDELKYKIILVGDSCVGKSSIFSRFVFPLELFQKEEAFQKSKVTMVDFKLKEVNIPEEIDSIKLFIWDTAGQERFRSIVSTYFKGCHGVLLTFDLSNRATFESAKNDWMPILKKKAQFATILLVGNKSDLKQSVDDSEIEAFAKQNRLVFVKTTIKEQSSIETAFTKLTTMVNKRRHEIQRPQSFYLKERSRSQTKKPCCLFN